MKMKRRLIQLCHLSKYYIYITYKINAMLLAYIAKLDLKVENKLGKISFSRDFL